MINELPPQFQSSLAPLMTQFVQMKLACGYRFCEGIRMLKCFDRYLSADGLAVCELPRSNVQEWLAKRPHESALTQQCRINIVSQFARFVCRLGHPAYVPNRLRSMKTRGRFSLRIL